MEKFDFINIKITKEDKEVCKKILTLLDSPDSETRHLGRILFKTTELYKFGHPKKLYVPNTLSCYNKFINLQFLVSGSYTFSSGNYYFLNFKNLILLLSNNSIFTFYQKHAN